jgi:hypothetical protein
MPFMLRCHDGRMSPMVIKCEHICNGTAAEYIRIRNCDPDGETDDYLCPTCYELHEGEGDETNLDGLTAICLDCVRKATRHMKEREVV